jgi:hypothetical protein
MNAINSSTNTMGRRVSVNEGYNEVFEIPRLNCVDQENSWYTKDFMKQFRQEARMMAQIRSLVKEKLEQEEEYDEPETLEERLDEVSELEPGQIADFLQKPAPTTKRKVARKKEPVVVIAKVLAEEKEKVHFLDFWYLTKGGWF